MTVFDKLLYIYDFIRPLLDIGILAFIFFKVYEFISKTNSMQIIKALVVIDVFYVIAILLKLSTLLWLINIIVPGLVVAIVVIFQPEIRKLFLRLGQSNWSKFGSRLENTSIEEILEAAEWLAKEKRGMLVVFERQSQLETSTLVRLDTILNADISKELLQTIFATDTPLHDGACLVKDGKLVVEKEGTDEYRHLLKILDGFLEAYLVKDDKGVEYFTGENRLYVPYVFFLKDGEVVATHLDTVESQENPFKALDEQQYEELYSIYTDYIHDMLGDLCDERC